MEKSKWCVILDDGHGQHTHGKRSPKFDRDTLIDGRLYKKGYQFIENDFNYKVVDYLDEILKKEGVFTYQIAPSHEDISLRERIKKERFIFMEAVRSGRSPIFVSIHANAHTEKWNNANGIETFHFESSSKGKRLATLVQTETIKNTGLRDRGVKTHPAFYLVRKSKSPAILFEGGFMTNEEEVLLLGSSEYQKLIAKSIFTAIGKYYSN